MELARAIKGEDEINAMRCAVHATDSAIKVMHDHLEPGVSEQRLWSYLHAENIARGVNGLKLVYSHLAHAVIHGTKNAAAVSFRMVSWSDSIRI